MSRSIISAESDSNQSNSWPHFRNKKMYSVLLISAIALIIIIRWGSQAHQHVPSWTFLGSAPPTVHSDLSIDDLKTLDLETVTAMQRSAAQRVGDSIYTAEISGPITHRPAFISPVEWLVVKEVAARHIDHDEALTRLVNNFRFIKQMELWQSMASGENLNESLYDVHQVDRRELAEHLLEMIPTRLAANDMSKSQAQQAQMALITDIETDPQRRHQRLREEFQRIGVQFEIDQRSAQH